MGYVYVLIGAVIVAFAMVKFWEWEYEQRKKKIDFELISYTKYVSDWTYPCVEFEFAFNDHKGNRYTSSDRMRIEISDEQELLMSEEQERELVFLQCQKRVCNSEWWYMYAEGARKKAIAEQWDR